MEKKKRTTPKSSTTPGAPAKKAPRIIQLTEDDLQHVVGAARCPPATVIIMPDDE